MFLLKSVLLIGGVSEAGQGKCCWVKLHSSVFLQLFSIEVEYFWRSSASFGILMFLIIIASSPNCIILELVTDSCIRYECKEQQGGLRSIEAAACWRLGLSRLFVDDRSGQSRSISWLCQLFNTMLVYTRGVHV